MASLSLRAVEKHYGHGAGLNRVIHGINAEIADGEFVVIVGPSGCGKSTLLRMVAGLEEISGGEIAIGGRVVNRLEPAERDIAMVFQNYALYPHMSVYDNMAYGLRNAGMPKAEIDARVRQAAQALALDALLQRRPGQLSGGQRQRVAMGRAIVRQPQVFLFDEPLSNLDAQLRVQTRLEIQRLHAELRVTSLFVTHDQAEAMTLAQRMIVLNAGRVEQFGTPEAVYRRPASRFVAGFIGAPAMNLLRGRADGERFVVGDQVLTLPGPAPRDGALVLGVRPEHARAAEAGFGAAWPLQVRQAELLGAERLVHGTLAGVPFTWRIDSSDPAPPPAAMQGLAVAAEHLHWFDADSGLRIGD
jgi:sn-glycerol 3-phosphate transport system ATP-binding protein